jgi:hypothetical protein
VTDYELIPLGSNCFLPKNRIGFSEKPSTPLSSMQLPAGLPGAWPTVGGYPPHQLPFPYYPYPPPPYNPTQFGYPPHGPPMLSATPGHTFYGPQLTTPAVHVPNSSVPGPSSSTTSSRMGVDQWCDKFDLGDEEREGLKKLGFRVGDNLTLVDAAMWAISGLAPLHRQRILAAYNANSV